MVNSGMRYYTFSDAPDDPDQEYWYRAEHKHDASFDLDGNWVHSSDWCKMYQYKVIKHTPKGVWLDVHGDKTFVLGTARKQFAVPTKELAYLDFLYRSDRYVGIYKARVRTRETAMAHAIGKLRDLDVEIPKRCQHIVEELDNRSPDMVIQLPSLLRGKR